jgi:hypothetical protein
MQTRIALALLVELGARAFNYLADEEPGNYIRFWNDLA